MNICDAELRLAKDIIFSWRGRRSNHIVVAPPMSRPRAFFNQLENKLFLEELLGEVARQVCVAKLDTIHFKSEATFVDAALVGWGIYGSTQLRGLDPIGRLEAGVRLMVNRGSKPVLTVQRFHEALTKLGEDIGTALRNLEHDLGLMTVVELPVSLGVLRERWDLLSDNKAPFLASDWGQGHSSRLLKGYSKDEVDKIGASHGITNREILDFVLDATSGLPELVHLVLEDCVEGKLASVKAKVRRRSLVCCERIVRWLDKPNDNLYKRLFSDSASGSSNSNGGSVFSLQDHDWKELFSKRGSVQRPLMVAWACVDSLIDADDVRFNNFVYSLFDTGKYVEFLEISNQARPSVRSFENRWLCLSILAKFGIFSDPFNPNWQALATVLLEVEGFIDADVNQDDAVYLSSLLEWRDLVGLMLRYQSAKVKNPGLRLEEFVCTGKSQKIDLISFVQILRLRLERALKMDDYLSVKSIIEQPETLLQIYSHIRHGLKFWSCTELDQCLADRVGISMRRPFSLPKKGNPIGFVELMYLSFQLSLDKGEIDSFAPTFATIEEVSRLYEIRKDQVHSTSFISACDARAYHEWCSDWLGKLEITLGLGSISKLTDVKGLSGRLLLK